MKKSGHKAIFALLSTLLCGAGGGFMYWMMQQGRLNVVSEDTILMSAVSLVLPVLLCVVIAIITEHHTWQAAIGCTVFCWAVGSLSADSGFFNYVMGENAVLIRTLFTFFLPLVLTYLGSLFCIFKEKEYEYTYPSSNNTYYSPSTNETETDAYGRPTGRPY